MDDLQQATEPYGDWLDTPEYGRVWRPDPQVVGDDWIAASARILAGRAAPPALPPRSGPPAPLHRGPPRTTIAAARPGAPPRAKPAKPPTAH